MWEVLVPKKISLVKNYYKYSIGCLYNDKKVKTLYIMLPCGDKVKDFYDKKFLS